MNVFMQLKHGGKGPVVITLSLSAQILLQRVCRVKVAFMRLFFSFHHNLVKCPCALVDWYSHMSNSPDENAGMWMVEPVPVTEDDFSKSCAAILYLNTIVWAAHLIPVFDHRFVSQTLSCTDTSRV
jgi:hypothetical protein